TAIRTIKRSLNSSLSTIRSNSAFIESPLKASRCSEPIEPVTNVTGVKGHWLGPKIWKGKQAQAILLHVHDIGYVSSPSGIQSLCYLLRTLRTKHDKHVRIFVVDHALAPENPYPNGLCSVKRAYRWLTASGIPGSQNVFLCGTSTGGTLILALLQKLYTTSTLPRPLGVILISPWVEVSCDALSYFTNSKFDILTTYFCQLATRSYLFGEDDNSINGKDIENFQKDQREIAAWLEGIECASNSIDEKKNVENNEKNAEWKHEVVNVKNHSGEDNKPKKKRRGSRASRNSRKSRNTGGSRKPSSSETERKTGMASARSSLTSVADEVQKEKKLAKRASTIRFSDSLEIHTQADLDDIANIKRGSWIRK
ncbi:6758_t:CDS:2, partial [Acaulospora morrowiae]